MSDRQKREALIHAHEFRHATKQFDASKSIDQADFETILEVARLSPSSVGLEPWRFLVIENKALREKIKQTSWGAKDKVMDASRFVIILARTAADVRYDANYIKTHYLDTLGFKPERVSGIRQMLEHFQRDDFKLLDDPRYLTDWAKRQTYIPLANMMTVAAEMGIDSCPIEGFNELEINQLLGAEGLLDGGNFTVSVMVAFGYRVNVPYPKTRRPVTDVVQWVE